MSVQVFTTNMGNDNNGPENGQPTTEVVVKAPDLEGVVGAIGAEGIDVGGNEEGPREVSEEFVPMVETLEAIYQGVEQATETDSRGRSRKKIREFADREDLDNEVVGHHLRVLQEHGLVVRDGNRWRIPPE